MMEIKFNGASAADMASRRTVVGSNTYKQAGTSNVWSFVTSAIWVIKKWTGAV